MDPLTFDDEDLHLRVDRGMFERFNLNSPIHTFRVPLRMRLGALVHDKKPHKLGQLFFGIVRDPNSELYGTARFDFRFMRLGGGPGAARRRAVVPQPASARWPCSCGRRVV